MSSKWKLGSAGGSSYAAYRFGAGAIVAVCLASVAYNYQRSATEGVAAVAPKAGATRAIPNGDGINLIAQRETFAGAQWKADGSTVELNSAIALNGKGAAARLVESGGPRFHRILLTVSGLAPGSIYTFSIFVRPQERVGIALEARDAHPHKSYGRVDFLLRTHAVIYRTEGVVDANIVPIANGWYRCWISLKYTDTQAVINIALLNGAAERIYNGDSRSGLGLWGAQFELGSLGMYLPNPPAGPGPVAAAMADGASPTLSPGTGLNLLQPSENFADARWQPDGATVESAAAAPPSGTAKAQRLVEADAPGRHRIEAHVADLARGELHTFSLFVKPEQRNTIVLEARDQDPTKAYGRATFDLSKNVVVARTDEVADAGITAAAGGWYRCWVSLAYQTGSAVVDIGLMNAAHNVQYQGDGRSGVDLWGAQFERGGAPGKYAQTNGGPTAHPQ